MQKTQLTRLFSSTVLAAAFCSPRRLESLGLVGILTIAAGAHYLPAARASQLVSWEFDPYTNELQVTVPEGTTPRYFVMSQPPRIVLDIPNSQMGLNPIQQNYPGLVRQIRVAQFEPGVARIVMDLAPDIVLETRQVELQPVGQGNRWRLRPTIEVSQAIPNVETSTTQLPAPIDRTRSGTLPSLSKSPSDRTSVVSVPPLQPAPESQTVEISVPALQIPPDSQAVEINVPPPPPPPSLENPTPEVSLPPPPPPNQPSSVSVPSAITNPSRGSGEDYVPGNQMPEVTIRVSESVPAALQEGGLDIAPTPPPETPTSIPVIVATTATSEGVVEFGQPLPVESRDSLTPTQNPTATGKNFSNMGDVAAAIASENPPLTAVPDSPNNASEVAVGNIPPDVLVSAGTFLILSYPGTAPLILEGDSRQEVLLVQADLYDRTGNLIAPVGTPVLGRFESDRGGSRFIAQSIILSGRSVAIAAESEPLSGNRDVSQRRFVGYSAVGAVAGALIGGLAGGPLLGGAAAGAAATYLSSPKPATIQPGQIMPVRLTEHWR